MWLSELFADTTFQIGISMSNMPSTLSVVTGDEERCKTSKKRNAPVLNARNEQLSSSTGTNPWLRSLSQYALSSPQFPTKPP